MDVTNISIAKVNNDRYEKNLGLCSSCSIYPIEYKCTKLETNMTTKSIIALNISSLSAQLTVNDSDFIQ